MTAEFRRDMMSGAALIAGIMLPLTPAIADDQPVSTTDIIVTAQKRSQSINEVPISITAATGDQLLQSGVKNANDLAKVVPGLTVQPTPLNTPVYTLRGVGFFEYSLATPPTVAVYVDEVPLPISPMTRGTALDLERVEVLKGPQGTLFGQNTTGGAINFIAAKPTDSFKAGADLSYGRFSELDFQGFLSGPIANDLNARLSFRVLRGDDWQRSISRQDTLGARREMQGRLLLDWHPTDRLTVAVNLNGWIDKSDTQAPQRIGTTISVPGSPNEPAILALPPVPQTLRNADWTNTDHPLKRDDYFVQGSVRADYDVTDSITLTSITALERYKTNAFQDFDGSPLAIADVNTYGHMNSFSQEVRLSGTTPRLKWIIGANYSRDKAADNAEYHALDSTTNIINTGAQLLFGGYATAVNDSTTKTASVFGNVEVEPIDNLTIQGGVRYTDSRRDNASCGRIGPGPGPGFSYGPIFEFLQTVLNPGTPVVPVLEGDCYQLNAAGRPIIDPYQDKLNEDNISWRGVVNYKTANRGLIYASVSKGYKAGSFPTFPAAAVNQLLKIKQESLLAYEVGFKQPLFDHMLQVNGAAFYYDYKDKQLRGQVRDLVFGQVDALVQIPKSRVKGAELEITAQPMTGLRLSVAGTYLDTRIKQFVGYNQAGVLADFQGSKFPFAPKWSVVGNAQYDFPINDNLKGFVGGAVLYNSKTAASIGEGTAFEDPRFAIKAYTLVDLRAGLTTPDEKWKFSVWGRNIFNKYYWTSVNQSQDVVVRFTGRPATYGVSISYRY